MAKDTMKIKYLSLILISLMAVSNGLLVSPGNQHNTDELYAMIQQLNATLVRQENINNQQSATIQSLLQKESKYRTSISFPNSFGDISIDFLCGKNE